MVLKERTHSCGELTIAQQGQPVILNGWIHRRRDHGGVIFIDLRDLYGLTQIVIDPLHTKDLIPLAESLRSEWTISITGKVRPRPEGMRNPKLKTGEIEVLVEELTVYSPAKTPPFSIADEHVEVHEENRLKYRYLDIRRGEIAQNLVLRHRLMQEVRNFLDTKGFLEISTPILGKSTPEGARDYLVPSRIHPEHFYALPQSPQIFKQLLMVAGMDRYFQIASCFRDEDLRADRQPEFTQIDIEMSFASPQTLQNLMEEMFKSFFKKIKNIDISTPFPRISHKDALRLYGTDRPDTRFGMEHQELTNFFIENPIEIFRTMIDEGGIVKAFCVPQGAELLSRRQIDTLVDFAKELGMPGLGWAKRTGPETTLQGGVSKLFGEEIQEKVIKLCGINPGDLFFILGGAPKKTHQALDHLRRRVAKDLKMIPENTYSFVWVTEFPLFAFNEEEGRFVSEHHPFTAPVEEDLPFLESDLGRVRSEAYDLVLNGYEVGGGSARIYHPDLQKQIFKVLSITEEEIEERFGFFVKALSYGTPPHLGIAFGLDRLVMILSQTENIRDVIAFPKTQKASDLMLEAPSLVSKKQLSELSIEVRS